MVVIVEDAEEEGEYRGVGTKVAEEALGIKIKKLSGEEGEDVKIARMKKKTDVKEF
jgi:hypothetical protein